MYWTRSPPEADSIYSVSSRNFLRTFHLLSTSVFSVEKNVQPLFTCMYSLGKIRWRVHFKGFPSRLKEICVRLIK